MNHPTYKEALYHFLLAEQAKKIHVLSNALSNKSTYEKSDSPMLSEEDSLETHPSTPTQTSKLFM